MRSLRTNLMLAFLAVSLLLGLSVAVLSFYVVRSQIIGRAQERANRDIVTARDVFEAEQERMADAFALVGTMLNVANLQMRLELDYLFVVPGDSALRMPSGIVRRAAAGRACGGVRVANADELRLMGSDLVRNARIELCPTPKARPSDRTAVEDAMVIEYARPLVDSTGQVIRVIYGGRMVNRYFKLVDRIRDIVYENELYKGRPLGTVTIFFDDVRIATNVLTNDGKRAIGTRLSNEVYENVLVKGQRWNSRAFVVNDWYLTSYEPLHDIDGATIGVLYVGVLERQFTDMEHKLLLAISAITGLGVLLAFVFSLVLSQAVARPVRELQRAANRLSTGDLSHRAEHLTKVRELAALLDEFNAMAVKLKGRDDELRVTNDKLENLNKTYLDLVGMVSHELKGILATTMLNAYSLRDGFLGLVNFKQKKALTSITRSLDYLDATVRNFLNLSRIEKDELALHIQPFRLKEDIASATLEAFGRQAHDKGMRIVDRIPADLRMEGDASLIEIVLNNLVGNAVKYGVKDGEIRLEASTGDETVAVEVYNDGRPLTDEDKAKLFKRFSRLDTTEGRKVRGTGIGLFIARRIVQQHGGNIRAEAREQGNSFIFTLPLRPMQSVGNG
jgi:two-component system, NtrC family, sensor kinase